MRTFVVYQLMFARAVATTSVPSAFDADATAGERVDEGSFALELLQVAAREIRRPENEKVEAVLAGTRSHLSADLQGIDSKQWPELDMPDGWTWNVQTPVKIVAWTGQFFVSADILKASIPHCTFEFLSTHADEFGPDASTPETEFITTDPETDISDADVVLFYLPYLKRNLVLPSQKRPGQLWIATCGEPVSRPATGMDCSLLNDAEIMSWMDGVASYHGTSEFPTYNDPPYEYLMRQEVPDFKARGPEIATFAFSDCRSMDRRDWLGAIMDRFDERDQSGAILSYGKCFNNAIEPDPRQCEQRWFDWWTNRCASRPFKLVAENTLEPWYITEKLWDAFVEGAIPVYFGPAEVKKLVPPHSILYAGDYDTPAELADAMLDFSDEAFARAREWKQRPVSEWGGYLKARRNSHYTLLPRLCEAGAAAKAAIQQISASVLD